MKLFNFKSTIKYFKMSHFKIKSCVTVASHAAALQGGRKKIQQNTNCGMSNIALEMCLKLVPLMFCIMSVVSGC